MAALAIVVALSFLAILLGRIVTQGYSTFIDYQIAVPVHLDASKIDKADPTGANYDMLVANSVLAKLGETDDEFGNKSGKVLEIMSNDLGFQLLKMVREDPSLIGKTVTVTGPVKSDAALYFKGQIKRATPEDERKLDNEQLDWMDKLKASGAVSSGFNTGFLTRSDSTEPEQAGVLGAIVGSLMMLLVTATLAIPIGVLAATYLEEFAPKNRWTDLIEVNINNLAAVPSIVYGLLGLAVFINWLAVPRSSPLVGGLGAGADVAADRDHRHPLGAQGRAALDPRGRARGRRLTHPDRVPPRAAAGHARRDDRLDPVAGPRPGRDRAAADDRHGLVRARRAGRFHRRRHRPACSGVHLGERLRARLP